jgi:hypothetical protein
VDRTERATRRHTGLLAGPVALIAIAILVGGCAMLPTSLALDPIGSQPGDGLGPLPTLVPTEPTPATDADDGAQGAEPVRFRPPRKWKGPFTLDLYRRDAHVAQYTASWCVGASMQMMINLIDRGPLDRSRRTQARLYRMARQISPWVETRPGASLHGWAGGLEQLGYGTFQEMAASSRQAVLKLAARQMRLTNRPVGLWVWRGKHAWVMSGFRATADPAVTGDFRVTHVWIEDPWYGRVSSIWGRGLPPHSLVTAQELGRDFFRWSSDHRPEYGSRGKFTILAPVT